MNTHSEKTQENKSHAVFTGTTQKSGGSESSLQFVDNRPQAIAQRKLHEMANNSQSTQLQAIAANYSQSTVQKQGIEDEELLQGKYLTVQNKSVEEEELLQGKFEPMQLKENNTGLPDNLKSGIENLSGYSLDDVKVNYNSEKPAQLNAHAYAQGTDIHLASGQEKHLPHEAWHVVQQ